MYEVVVSDRFAVWYEGLPEARAEEVTLALHVAAGLGRAIDPARSRQFLLWFDGSGERFDSELERQLDQHAALLGWGHRMASCLESTAFRDRLAELEPELAREVLLAVARVKSLLVSARMINALSAYGLSGTVRLSVEERWLDELIQAERKRGALLAMVARKAPEKAGHGAHGEAPGPLYLAVLELLRLAGLNPNLFFDDQTRLRELVVGEGPARSRLICGVDVPRRRIIAILGERLDRRYYGDSVKFAEAYFRDYLAQQELALANGEEPRTP
jgi:hypothetical protein